MVYDRLDEMPILNWDRLSKESDLSYLLKPGVTEKVPDSFLISIYKVLQDEYTDLYVLTDEFKDDMMLQKEAAELRIDAIVSGDMTLLNIANAIEGDPEEEKINNNKDVTLEETLVVLEKYMGFYMDPKIVTVAKYFSYIEMMRAEAKVNEMKF